MPLQQCELLECQRSDLVNVGRFHGGTAHVGLRGVLHLRRRLAPRTIARIAPGKDATVLHAERLTFTARYGHPALMPRREQLLRAGRSDLCYAIIRDGAGGLLCCCPVASYVAWV